MKAAERFAAWALELDLETIPPPVVEAAKLHVLDVIGCGLAAHGLGIAAEGRATMSELGGEPEASVIGLDDGTAGAERRVRERDALPRARLRRHPLRVGRARVDGGRAGGRRARRGPRRERPRAPGGRDRRQRDHDSHRHGGARRLPQARLPPDCDLRDLRRDGCGRAPRRAGTGRVDERARHRRQHGLRSLRLPRRRDGDEADPSRLGRARRAARRAAGGARRGGPAGRPRGPLRRLPRVRRRAHRPRAAARRPRRAVGDAADRVQALPGLPFHPRVARRHRDAHRRDRPRRDRGGRGDVSRRRAWRSCSSRWPRRWRREPTTRASSASSTRRRRCSSTVTSA